MEVEIDATASAIEFDVAAEEVSTSDSVVIISSLGFRGLDETLDVLMVEPLTSGFNILVDEMLEVSVVKPLAFGFNTLVDPPRAAAFSSAALFKTATSSFRSTQCFRFRTMDS